MFQLSGFIVLLVIIVLVSWYIKKYLITEKDEIKEKVDQLHTIEEEAEMIEEVEKDLKDVKKKKEKIDKFKKTEL